VVVAPELKKSWVPHKLVRVSLQTVALVALTNGGAGGALASEPITVMAEASNSEPRSLIRKLEAFVSARGVLTAAAGDWWVGGSKEGTARLQPSVAELSQIYNEAAVAAGAGATAGDRGSTFAGVLDGFVRSFHIRERELEQEQERERRLLQVRGVYKNERNIPQISTH